MARRGLTRPRRTRMSGACKACRRKHFKCDLEEPSCNRCRTSGVRCERDPLSLRWLTSTRVRDDDPVLESPEDLPSRQQLYTEKRREAMCDALVAGIPHSLAKTLAQVDDDSRQVQEHKTRSIALGPFNVFKFDRNAASSSFPCNHTNNNPETEQWADEAIRHDMQSPSLTSTLVTGIEAPSDPLDFLHWADLFGHDGELPFSDFGPDLLVDTTFNVPNWNPYEPVDTVPNALPQSVPEVDVLSPPIDLINDAPVLLKHYSDKVIDQFGSLPINQKSPWKTLNVPLAIITLSKLTILAVDSVGIKHAHLANFYGIMTAAAFHLSLGRAVSSGTERSEGYWGSLCGKTHTAAKAHLRLSLETESSGDDKAKYKEQLMAIHVTIASAFISGNEHDARLYLTETERLIRCRGLTKKDVSRNARQLHHIYAWTRIVCESTNVSMGQFPAVEESKHAKINVPRTDDRAIRYGHCDREMGLDDFLRIETRHGDGYLNIFGQKDPGSAAQDIHLEDSRQDQENMYMEIYGVPETWLSLVSQTTRLANAMDRLSMSDGSATEFLHSLQTRISELEDAIWAFVTRIRSNTSGPDDAKDARGVTVTPHISMMRALSAALPIFFYRRIRNLSPLALENSVDSVIEALHDFERAIEQSGSACPGTGWPAFVAGAEAMTSHQRRSITAWLDRALDKSGFVSYQTSKEILHEVWRRRDQDYRGQRQGGQFQRRDTRRPTWIDVCKDWQRWPLLC